MNKILFLMILIVSVFSFSCSQCKKAGTLRCKDNTIQVCTSHHYWRNFKNCEKYEAKCGEKNGKTTCVKCKKTQAVKVDKNIESDDVL